MTSLSLTEEERTIARGIQPRAAELRHLIESYDAAAVQLITLAHYLNALGEDPSVLYALDLTEKAYLALTGFPLARRRKKTKP